MNTPRKLIKHVIVRTFDLYGDLQEVVDRLQKYLQDYPDASFEIGDSISDSWNTINAYDLVDYCLESDFDYEKRLLDEGMEQVRLQQIKDDNDRSQYETLKKKFGGAS